MFPPTLATTPADVMIATFDASGAGAAMAVAATLRRAGLRVLVYPDAEKIGKDLTEAIFLPPNNFPHLHCDLPKADVPVTKGLVDATEVDRVAAALAGAEVLLYSAPSGRPATARAYAEAACKAGVAFINTTSDAIARDPMWIDRFEAAGLPLPIYQVVESSGPPHDPTFTVEVRVSGKRTAQASGKSKRAAEQAAAASLMADLRS